jgi:hypothetical protein
MPGLEGIRRPAPQSHVPAIRLPHRRESKGSQVLATFWRAGRTHPVFLLFPPLCQEFNGLLRGKFVLFYDEKADHVHAHVHDTSTLAGTCSWMWSLTALALLRGRTNSPWDYCLSLFLSTVMRQLRIGLQESHGRIAGLKDIVGFGFLYSDGKPP